MGKEAEKKTSSFFFLIIRNLKRDIGLVHAAVFFQRGLIDDVQGPQHKPYVLPFAFLFVSKLWCHQFKRLVDIGIGHFGGLVPSVLFRKSTNRVNVRWIVFAWIALIVQLFVCFLFGLQLREVLGFFALDGSFLFLGQGIQFQTNSFEFLLNARQIEFARRLVHTVREKQPENKPCLFAARIVCSWRTSPTIDCRLATRCTTTIAEVHWYLSTFFRQINSMLLLSPNAVSPALAIRPDSLKKEST